MSVAGILSFFISFLLVTIAYTLPVYFSFKSLETRSGVEIWLTYWLVLGLYNTLEWWLFIPLAHIFIMPFMKLAFVLWLQLPITKGSQIMYAQVVAPLLRKYQTHIDKHLETGKGWSQKHLSQFGLGDKMFNDTAQGSSASTFEGRSKAVSRYAASGGSLDTPDIENARAASPDSPGKAL